MQVIVYSNIFFQGFWRAFVQQSKYHLLLLMKALKSNKKHSNKTFSSMFCFPGSKSTLEMKNGFSSKLQHTALQWCESHPTDLNSPREASVFSGSEIDRLFCVINFKKQDLSRSRFMEKILSGRNEQKYARDEWKSVAENFVKRRTKRTHNFYFCIKAKTCYFGNLKLFCNSQICILCVSNMIVIYVFNLKSYKIKRLHELFLVALYN